MKTQRFMVAILAGMCGAILPGCTSSTQLSLAMEYPVELEEDREADIHVFRDETILRMTNSTAESFEPGVLWINSEYGHAMNAWPIGKTISLNLNTFRNEFGQVFRGGGFFATETPTPLVRAQLQQGNELVGLTVIEE